MLNLWPQTAASNSEDDRLAAKLGDGMANRWYLDPLTGRGYPEDVQAYLDTDLWKDKAGAFGFQDGLDWVHLLEGSESNVVGLPLERLRLMLAELERL